jgi:phosphatidylserine decarboxylase
MDTVWAGTVTPAAKRVIRRVDYAPGEVVLERGAEMGRCNMGSTVIVVLPPGVMADTVPLSPNEVVKVGQSLGRLVRTDIN